MENEREELQEQTTLFEDNAEYDAFTAKFEPKKTSDDCYTPENIYRTVSRWVAEEYGLNAERFLRPFWPGGDYEREYYPDGCVVVDNPPFSCLKQIVVFYNLRSIPFFLFCPALTPPNVDDAAILAVGCDVVYENGATISTSFVTNLEPGIVLRTAPDLYRALKKENDINLAQLRRRKPKKYEYPANIITPALAQRYSQYGIRFTLREKEAVKVRALDAQREAGKEIFGYGWLISDEAADNRLAANHAADAAALEEKENRTTWRLSDREKAIVRSLGKETTS